jgi:hypothetical protein
MVQGVDFVVAGDEHRQAGGVGHAFAAHHTPGQFVQAVEVERR